MSTTQSTKNRKSSFFWISTRGPFFVFLALTGGVAWLFYQAILEIIQTAIVTAAATGVLVLVTSYYTWQAQLNAEYTEETLEEMRKDREKEGRILTIAFGIDPVRKELDGRRDDWNQAIGENEDGLPVIEGRWTLPDEEFLNDISEAYESVESDLRVFIRMISSYQDDREVVHVDLRSEIRERFQNDNSTEDVPPEIMANYLLNPEGTYGYSEAWENLRDDLNQIRLETLEENTLTELRDSFQEIRSRSESLSDELGTARKEFKKTYSITDLEVEETVEQSELSPAQIIEPAHT